MAIIITGPPAEPGTKKKRQLRHMDHVPKYKAVLRLRKQKHERLQKRYKLYKLILLSSICLNLTLIYFLCQS